MRLTKKHAGRSVDFRDARNPQNIINGRIDFVRHGVARIVYWLPNEPSPPNGFSWWADVRDPRIVAIY